VDGTSNQNRGTDAAQAWREVVSQFRNLCFLRRQGNADESGKILKEILPRQIAAWSHSTEQDMENKRQTLEQMFRDEQRRVDDVCALHELSSNQWRKEMVPLLTSKISNEVRTAVQQQIAEQAAQQNQLAQEIKQALAEQSQVQSARQAAQQALIESIEKNLAQTLQAVQSAPPPIPKSQSAAAMGSSRVATMERIPFDDIPAIIDSIHDEERRHPSARRSFSAMPTHEIANRPIHKN
jgi:hypothetical protein